MMGLRVLLLGLLGMCSLAAEPLLEWRFEDAAGTPMSKLKNTGSYEGVWDGDFADTVTDGSGALVVNRVPRTLANVFVALNPPAGEPLPDPLWVVVDIAGWHFRGDYATETLRLGLAHARHEQRPSVLAQLRMGRVASDQVMLTAEGFGEGSDDMRDLPLFSATHETPVRLVLMVHRAENRFECHLQQGDALSMFLGKGELSPERTASFLRLGFSGHFAASNEFLKLKRIALVKDSPL